MNLSAWVIWVDLDWYKQFHGIIKKYHKLKLHVRIQFENEEVFQLYSIKCPPPKVHIDINYHCNNINEYLHSSPMSCTICKMIRSGKKAFKWTSNEYPNSTTCSILLLPGILRYLFVTNLDDITWLSGNIHTA